MNLDAYQAIVNAIKQAVASEPDAQVVEHNGVTYNRHNNRGGWVATTASVDPTAYIGKTVVVCDDTTVGPNARVTGEVVVGGKSVIHAYGRYSDARGGPWCIDTTVGPFGSLNPHDIVTDKNPWQ